MKYLSVRIFVLFCKLWTMQYLPLLPNVSSPDHFDTFVRK